jgi:hypothetical protein
LLTTGGFFVLPEVGVKVHQDFSGSTALLLKLAFFVADGLPEYVACVANEPSKRLVNELTHTPPAPLVTVIVFDLGVDGNRAPSDPA